ncbi:hypothetical protein MBLNU457_4829t1 [Dothideomycetes sp. NU457]
MHASTATLTNLRSFILNSFRQSASPTKIAKVENICIAANTTSSRPQRQRPFRIIGPINRFPSKARIQRVERQVVNNVVSLKNASSGGKTPLKLNRALLDAHF